MPMPVANTEWPPKALAPIFAQLDAYDAWYTGDRERLALVYGGQIGYDNPTWRSFDRQSQHRGGIVGSVARWFWGEPRYSVEGRPNKLHVPVAADIATTSAGLLFSEHPTIKSEDQATQDRLDELLDDHFWATVSDGAELEAGLGGVYFRVSWDVAVADRPIITDIGADLAIPTFSYGRLQEVTFTWELSRDNNNVIRHLEHHIKGRVEHALFRGTDTNLGQMIPLDEAPQTQTLIEAVDEQGSIATGLDMLDVVYVPSLPARRWRRHGIGSDMGQPDIAGVEPIMDALDEAYTSWMRDIRLGKSRVVMSQAWLQNHGPGKGSSFDMDRELLIQVNIAPNQDAPLQLIQPLIRHEEHAATCTGLLERIIAGAGYSAQTFGLNGDVAMTATESNARERKSHQTRGAKIRRWAPGLSDLVTVMLAVDAQVFGSGVKPAPPTVEFPPAASDGIETLAQSAQLLRAAEAASTETLVRLTQPGIDDAELHEEVQRIEDEKAAAAAAPLMADPTLDNPHAPADAQPQDSQQAQAQRARANQRRNPSAK